MQLEDYFDFITEPVEAIRIKGTGLDIEFIVELFNRGMFPEAIVSHFGAEIVSLQQVYATITYYLQHKERIDRFIVEGMRFRESSRQKFEEGLSPEVKQNRERLVERLRGIGKSQGATRVEV